MFSWKENMSLIILKNLVIITMSKVVRLDIRM